MIPKDFYDYAAIEGANGWKKFRFVTLPCILPVGFFATVMALVHSFNVFREIYVLFGDYPNESIYMLQHYMNNQFNKLNFSNLTSASFLLTMVIAFIISGIYIYQKRRTSIE